MTVVVLAWFLGCDRGDRGPRAPASPAVAEEPAAGTAPTTTGDGRARAVELVLEPGRVTADGWESAPTTGDRLATPAGATAAGPARWTAMLPTGPGVARVARDGCGPVEVPYVVTPVAVVVLPYLACAVPDAPPAGAVRIDRDELPAALIPILHGLELFPDVPAPAEGEDDGPARWLTFDEARAICAWRGGRLPTADEWRAARAGGGGGVAVSDATRAALGPGPAGLAARALAGVPPRTSAAGHRDLDGNLEEWLADGAVAGGSWHARADELGAIRRVPPSARTDTIGARCAYD